MNKLSIALSALLMLLMVVVMAPGVFAMNRNNILRNIALWLAIFTGICLIYKTFGPGSPHPLFSLPYGASNDALARMPPENDTALPAPPAASDRKTSPTDSSTDSDANGDKGFTPPKEE